MFLFQVEERKRAIWEASISRREALLQRERDRTERLERQRAARSAPRPAFAFGSSTPRLLEPVDSAGFFWAARRWDPQQYCATLKTMLYSAMGYKVQYRCKKSQVLRMTEIVGLICVTCHITCNKERSSLLQHVTQCISFVKDHCWCYCFKTRSFKKI